MCMIPVKQFAQNVASFSHLYLRCNNHKKYVDIITVSPFGIVDRLCTLAIVNGNVDNQLFMNNLKKSIKTDLQTVYDCTR